MREATVTATDPASSLGATSPPRYDPSMLVLKEAAHLNRVGRHNEAARVLEESCRAAHAPRSPSLLADSHSETGFSLMMMTMAPCYGTPALLAGGAANLERAISEFDEALAVDPGHVSARINKAASFVVLGRFVDALAELDVALRIDPKNALALSTKGFALNSLGRHSEALAPLDLALQQNPAHANALKNKGEALLALKMPSEALFFFNSALSLNPKLSSAIDGKHAAALAIKQSNNNHVDSHTQELRGTISTLTKDLQECRKKVLELQSQLELSRAENRELTGILQACVMLEISQFNDPHLISCGAYGAVFSASHPSLSFQVCLKVMLEPQTDRISSPTQIRNKFRCEVSVLSRLPIHKNILFPISSFVATLPSSWTIQLKADYPEYESWASRRTMIIVMPHGGETLSSWLLRTDHQSPGVVGNLLKQALSAVHHVASHFITHRDIKGNNIVVQCNELTYNEPHLRLIDFGTAIDTERTESMTCTIPLSQDVWGNPLSIPPDISALLRDASSQNKYSVCIPYLNADSFALAFTFWQLLCVDPDHCTSDRRPALKANFCVPSCALPEILTCMLKSECNERLSASGALQILNSQGI
ncbi:hypothetical protein Pelo_15627 [Pelomyxa schiedti]|nr:hypothetical protein Pelo_15627 [Pelomyxa schiedti]